MFLGERIHGVPHLHADHRTGKRDEPRLSVNGQLKSREVAVSDNDFGIGANRAVVHEVEEPWRAVSAADGKDRLHLPVCKHFIQIAGSLFIGTREIAMLGEDVSPNLYMITQALEILNPLVDLLFRGWRTGG